MRLATRHTIVTMLLSGAMSPRLATRRLFRRAGAAALALAVLLPAAASAASRVEVLELPSARGNIDLRLAKTNDVKSLQARVLLPDGYDEQPDRTWPVTYLLHGVGDTSATWLRRENGDAQRGTAGLDAIVVMPEGGRGYWIDHCLGNTDKLGARWSGYVLEEVIPAIHARYRASEARSDHAIGGLSMGGYGAMVLASQLPGYFGQAIGFSGMYNIEAPAVQAFVPFFSNFSYTRMWCRAGGPYSRAVNPIRLLSNLDRTALYASTGNGLHDPSVEFTFGAAINGGATELLGKDDTADFVRSARARGITVTSRPHTAGTHSWPYWRRELRAWTATKPFATPATPGQETRTSFTYRSMQEAGNAWGLGFRFTKRPNKLFTIARDGQQLTLTGGGTVTLTPGAASTDATGAGSRTECAVTVTLPATATLAAGC